MNEEKHRAIVRISHELLRDMLFPKDAQILAVMADPQDIFGRGDFVCVVEHSDLPPVAPGCMLPEIVPIYRRIYSGERNQVDINEFEGWGIEKR